MFKFKTTLMFSLFCALMMPQPVHAIAFDIKGTIETVFSTAERFLSQQTLDSATESAERTNELMNQNDQPISKEEVDRPSTLTLDDDYAPIVTLAEIRNMGWGANGEQESSIENTELSIHKYLLIDPDTLQENSEFLPGGSKEGQKMTDTSETPNTVRAQQKQFVASGLRGQAIARTAMLKNEDMDKTTAKLTKTIADRDSVREWYQANAVLSTQINYLSTNMTLVRSAMVEVEAMQALQGQRKSAEGEGIAGILKSLAGGLF